MPQSALQLGPIPQLIVVVKTKAYEAGMFYRYSALQVSCPQERVNRLWLSSVFTV